MIVTEPLEQILTAPGRRELGIEDRELDEILSLTSQNRYLPAAERAQKLWQQQIYDVRTIGCYLFGVFVERGVASLSLLFECIRRAVADNLSFLSPTHKKERHLDVSLRWLFDSIVSQVRFHERQKDELWTKWNHDWQHAAQEQALEHCNQLIETLDQVIPGSRCKQPLLHLQSLLQGLARAPAANAGWDLQGATQIPAPPPPPGEDDESPKDDDSDGDNDSDEDEDNDSDEDEDSSEKDNDSEEDEDSSEEEEEDDAEEDSDDAAKDSDDESDDATHVAEGTKDAEEEEEEDEEEEEEKKEEEEEDEDNGAADKPASEPSSASAASARSPIPTDSAAASASSASIHSAVAGAAAKEEDTLSIPLGPELKLLLAELSGFVRLVGKQRYRRAAILQQHIAKKLQSFEPSRYFPTLLVDYLLALIQHSSKLEPHLKPAEDLETEMLRLLCRSDVQRFVADSER